MDFGSFLRWKADQGMNQNDQNRGSLDPAMTHSENNPGFGGPPFPGQFNDSKMEDEYYTTGTNDSEYQAYDQFHEQENYGKPGPSEMSFSGHGDASFMGRGRGVMSYGEMDHTPDGLNRREPGFHGNESDWHGGDVGNWGQQYHESDQFEMEQRGPSGQGPFGSARRRDFDSAQNNRPADNSSFVGYSKQNVRPKVVSSTAENKNHVFNEELEPNDTGCHGAQVNEENKKDGDDEESDDEVSTAIKKLPENHNRGLMSTLLALGGTEVLNRKPEPLPLVPLMNLDVEPSSDVYEYKKEDYLEYGITQDMLDEANIQAPNFTPEEVGIEIDTSMILCKLCQVQTTSIMNFRDHLNGRSHKATYSAFKQGRVLKKPLGKSRRRAGNVPISVLGKTSVVLETVENVKEPIIGLSYVTEYHSAGCIICVCNLCMVKFDNNNTVAHMSGIKHRLHYLRQYKPVEYVQVKKCGKRSVLSFRLDEISIQVEKGDGRGTPTIKVFDPSKIEKESVDEDAKTDDDHVDEDRKRLEVMTKLDGSSAISFQNWVDREMETDKVTKSKELNENLVDEDQPSKCDPDSTGTDQTQDECKKNERESGKAVFKFGGGEHFRRPRISPSMRGRYLGPPGRYPGRYPGPPGRFPGPHSDPFYPPPLLDLDRPPLFDLDRPPLFDLDRPPLFDLDGHAGYLPPPRPGRHPSEEMDRLPRDFDRDRLPRDFDRDRLPRDFDRDRLPRDIDRDRYRMEVERYGLHHAYDHHGREEFDPRYTLRPDRYEPTLDPDPVRRLDALAARPDPFQEALKRREQELVAKPVVIDYGHKDTSKVEEQRPLKSKSEKWEDDIQNILGKMHPRATPDSLALLSSNYSSPENSPSPPPPTSKGDTRPLPFSKSYLDLLPNKRKLSESKDVESSKVSREEREPYRHPMSHSRDDDQYFGKTTTYHPAKGKKSQEESGQSSKVRGGMRSYSGGNRLSRGRGFSREAVRRPRSRNSPDRHYEHRFKSPSSPGKTNKAVVIRPKSPGSPVRGRKRFSKSPSHERNKQSRGRNPVQHTEQQRSTGTSSLKKTDAGINSSRNEEKQAEAIANMLFKMSKKMGSEVTPQSALQLLLSDPTVTSTLLQTKTTHEASTSKNHSSPSPPPRSGRERLPLHRPGSSVSRSPKHRTYSTGRRSPLKRPVQTNPPSPPPQRERVIFSMRQQAFRLPSSSSQYFNKDDEEDSE